MSRWGRAQGALIALGLIAIMFVFVFPTRSYLAQRRQVAAAEHDVAVLRDQNDMLQAEADQLQTPDEIERMARQQFHMVRRGERAYLVMPAPHTTTTTVP